MIYLFLNAWKIEFWACSIECLQVEHDSADFEDFYGSIG